MKSYTHASVQQHTNEWVAGGWASKRTRSQPQITKWLFSGTRERIDNYYYLRIEIAAAPHVKNTAGAGACAREKTSQFDKYGKTKLVGILQKLNAALL